MAVPQGGGVAVETGIGTGGGPGGKRRKRVEGFETKNEKGLWRVVHAVSVLGSGEYAEKGVCVRLSPLPRGNYWS